MRVATWLKNVFGLLYRVKVDLDIFLNFQYATTIDLLKKNYQYVATCWKIVCQLLLKRFNKA